MAAAAAAEYPKQLNRSDHRGFQEEIIIAGGSRFDDLPDHILHHILGFLDIKFAVGTSSLSRRWRSTWKELSRVFFAKHGERIGRQNRAFESFLLGLRNAKSLDLNFVKSSEGRSKFSSSTVE
ncbi:unnamed protein product [Linum tenue]|uniref:F-box domain-containing protein n=1 Tax=Linum tenue TaxID=586396 RepID=A0AAV0GNI1_9ROSI|nr:unnamed protein product [Linum tenue]